MDLLTPIWHVLVFADCVRHERNIIHGYPDPGGGELAVGVTPDRLANMTHEGGMVDEESFAFDGLAMDERDSVTHQNKVSCLEGQGGTTRVRETYARTPGEEVILPGSVSNRLFSMMGSVQVHCA